MYFTEFSFFVNLRLDLCRVLVTKQDEDLLRHKTRRGSFASANQIFIMLRSNSGVRSWWFAIMISVQVALVSAQTPMEVTTILRL
jgi:hypothetical protein